MHIVITGASAGIGEAIAREFATPGNRLTLVARRTQKLEALASELPVPTRVVTWDLSDPTKAAGWCADAEAEHGPVDVLVNNAGMQIVNRTERVDPDHGDTLLRLNVLTPMRLTLALLPGMLERGGGTIVDIASLAALAPTPAMYYYNASKGALAAASESLRGELRGTGVHLVTVYPGPVVTDMANAALDKYEKPPWLPTGNVTQLAGLIRRAVEKRRARIIYPRVYHLARWFPGTTRWVVDRFSPLPK